MGYDSSGSDREAFVWTEAGGIEVLEDFGPLGVGLFGLALARRNARTRLR